MNEFNLPDIPDLTAVPSDELNARTLAAMRAAEPRKTAKKIPLRKRRSGIFMLLYSLCQPRFPSVKRRLSSLKR